jgi:hypothetical protein
MYTTTLNLEIEEPPLQGKEEEGKIEETMAASAVTGIEN